MNMKIVVTKPDVNDKTTPIKLTRLVENSNGMECENYGDDTAKAACEELPVSGDEGRGKAWTNLGDGISKRPHHDTLPRYQCGKLTRDQMADPLIGTVVGQTDLHVSVGQCPVSDRDLACAVRIRHEILSDGDAKVCLHRTVSRV